MTTPSPQIEGQLSETERHMLTAAIISAPVKPRVVIEVGTWLGGGSTLHILKALEHNQAGHLWGIEADRSIYERMLANIRKAAPEACHRFTPLFGFSGDVIRQWLSEQEDGGHVDLAFLDGGNNPGEQIEEFRLLDPHIPVGGQLMVHDARMRKGKWLVPYLSKLDNWESRVHDSSPVGLLVARKIVTYPSPESLRAANRYLFKQRCHPVELAASILPSGICGLLLNLLPARTARRLLGGRH